MPRKRKRRRNPLNAFEQKITNYLKESELWELDDEALQMGGEEIYQDAILRELGFPRLAISDYNNESEEIAHQYIKSVIKKICSDASDRELERFADNFMLGWKEYIKNQPKPITFYASVEDPDYNYVEDEDREVYSKIVNYMWAENGLGEHRFAFAEIISDDAENFFNERELNIYYDLEPIIIEKMEDYKYSILRDLNGNIIDYNNFMRRLRREAYDGWRHHKLTNDEAVGNYWRLIGNLSYVSKLILKNKLIIRKDETPSGELIASGAWS